MAFRDPIGSLLSLHKPTIGSSLEEGLSSLQYHNQPPSNPFLYYPLIYVSASLKVSFSQVFPLKLYMPFWIASIRATCLAHLSRLDLYVCMYVCEVFCLEAGPSLDLHYQGSMSSPFLSEPVTLWEYISLHTQTQEYCKYSYKASPYPK